MDHGKPHAAPGVEAHYSDTGYVLLGETIETLTGEGLAGGLRSLLKFDPLGMNATYLESLEERPQGLQPNVKRYLGTLDATSWKNAYWAKEKGLYARVFETKKELDEEVQLLASKLASYNPKALLEMKKSLWNGTEDWNNLLAERAAISGELVLSDFTKKALSKFKK